MQPLPHLQEFQPAVAARSFSLVRNLGLQSRFNPGRMPAASLNRLGMLTETKASGWPSRTLLCSDAANVSGGMAYSTHAGAVASVAGDTRASSSHFSYGSGQHARSMSAESIEWKEMMGVGSFERLLPTGDSPSPTTEVCESSEPSLLVPVQQMAARAHMKVDPQSLVHSPSLGATTSPASSALWNSLIGSGAYEVPFYLASYI